MDRPNARIAGFALALAAFALAIPAAASATVLPGDVALGAAVETSPTLYATAPDVECIAGIVQAEDGRVLWARKPDVRRAPASTTKIMTALVVLKRCRLDETTVVTTEAATVDGSRAGLVAGRRYTVKTLLEAMLVRSGCDAALALSQHVSRSPSDFVALMNREAKERQLSNTRYANPHGLDQAGAYTTARDLARLLRGAMLNPEFRRMSSLTSVVLDNRTLTSRNLLLGLYPGTVAGKTGTTQWAGASIAAMARRDGRTITAVVLGSPSDLDRYQDAARLLDWGVVRSDPQCIASFTTELDPAKRNRTINIARASGAIDQFALGPAGRFSFNGVVGERTAARGYLPAETVSGGSIVTDYGGGVCQVSTTVFNAALFAGLPVTQRRNHSLYIPEYPLGRDATVSWGGPDLAFTNPTASTVKVRALASGLSVTSSITGRSTGWSVSVATTPLTVYTGYSTRYIADSSMPSGTSRVLVQGVPGRRCSVTRTIRAANKSVLRVDTFPSVYPPVTRVVAIGTAP